MLILHKRSGPRSVSDFLNKPFRKKKKKKNEPDSVAEPVLNIESDESVEERNVTATVREECECRMRYVTLGVMQRRVHLGGSVRPWT